MCVASISLGLIIIFLILRFGLVWFSC